MARLGYRLTKSRRHDWTEGTYGVLDDWFKAWVLTGPNGWGHTLDDVAAWLAEPVPA